MDKDKKQNQGASTGSAIDMSWLDSLKIGGKTDGETEREALDRIDQEMRAEYIRRFQQIISYDLVRSDSLESQLRTIEQIPNEVFDELMDQFDELRERCLNGYDEAQSK